MNEFNNPDGATPLTNDEFHDLIPKHVTTQGELNSVEQLNLAQGILWLSKKKPTTEKILTEAFVRELHIQLFGKVWKWAGKFRMSDKNIGVDWLTVGIELKNLLEDCKYQIEHESYEIPEIAVRFHHRLVQIHPFPNGNGRHSRIITDQLLKALDHPSFTWGGNDMQNYSKQTENRKNYIHALREADKGNITPLLNFATQTFRRTP